MDATRYMRVLDVSNCIPLRNTLGEFDLTAYLIEEVPGTVTTHISLGIGGPQDGMLFRPNSACLTSEVFGCDRCDCKWQLWQALLLIRERGSGLVTYHPQHEGRGVGLFHKVKSYHVMDTLRCSTAEAFTRLALPADVRCFAPAALILRHLGVRMVDLLSNNPEKATALEREGIDIRTRIGLVADHVPHLREYLTSKQRDFGHDIAIS